ncbi:histidine kinase dimerization/phospho-acceptor domain-containing protein [Actinoplanes sp. CA-252034]|uniref:histidine kinase dimerization/phospho-acceptor domain-containing protein n=1 Tax=Actinoplanes sp. CA-252034 TaxID=3239906 RepID=UPI003D953CB8
MPDFGDRIWSVSRLLRAGVLLTLTAVVAVAATGFLRNDESLQAHAELRRSGEIMNSIVALRAAVEALAAPAPAPTPPVAPPGDPGEAGALEPMDPADVADPAGAAAVQPAAPDADPFSPPAVVATAPADLVRLRADEVGRLAGDDPVTRGLLARIDPAADIATLRAATDGMLSHEQVRLDRRIGDVGAVARNSRWLIVWVAVLAGIVVLIGGRVVRRRLTSTADQLAAAVRRAREGDLTPVEVRGPRELAGLAVTFNEAMAELGRARDRATAANAAGSAFLDAMSHEVRAPMTAVTGMTGMLLETELDERQRELATTVHDSGTTLLCVIDDLLDLARVESGDLPLDRRPFSLRGCVRRAMDPVTAAAEAKGLHLAAHLAAGCPERVRGDDVRVRRILTALLRQAVATTEHGAVTVSVSAHTRAEGLEVRFSIRDTGLGVPAEHRSDPGIRLARRLAASMDGGVTTETRPGRGTTVTVTVLLDEARQPDRFGRTPVEGRKQQLLVLVAEDDPVDQRLTRRQLERRGHRVLTVADGEAAVEAIQRDRYDLVLLGSGLLVLDGPSAARLMHADPPLHGVPRIVAICSDAEEREDFVTAGVDGVLPRPVDSGDLDVILATAAAYADVRLAGAGPLPGPDDGEPETIRACVDVIAGPDAEPEDRRRLAEILHNFADRLPGLLERMDEAAAGGDTRNLARLAHSLKASSATLGANRFAALCADLEDRALHDPATGDVLHDLHERAREISDTMETISRQLTRAS